MLKEQSCFSLKPSLRRHEPAPRSLPLGPRQMADHPRPRRQLQHVIIAGISGPELRPHNDTDHATLFLCRPGAATWSVTAVHSLWAQSDIAFHNGKLYLFKEEIYPYLLALDIGEDADGVPKFTLAKPFLGPSPLYGAGPTPSARVARSTTT